MAADGGLLFVAAGEAVEALRGDRRPERVDACRASRPSRRWSRAGGWVIAVTDAEIVAIRAKDGEVVWRHAAGGVRLPPAIDGDYLYAGADDGRVLALTLASGAVAWEQLRAGAASPTIAAHAGRVYAGAGDKQFYCLNGRSGKEEWPRSDRRQSDRPDRRGRRARVFRGAQQRRLRARSVERQPALDEPSSTAARSTGSLIAGHVVFVPAVGVAVVDVLRPRRPAERRDHAAVGDGARRSAAVRETAAGVTVFVVTGGLANEWMLTYIAPADDTSIVPFTGLTEMPGVPFLTDPVLQPIGQVLGPLVLGDPVLWPASEMGWPLVLRDPPLEPLTTLPGLQLRPLSPVLPIRREA